MVGKHFATMKKTTFLLCVLAMSAVLLTGCGTGGGMRWPIGISYVSGYEDVVDQYEDNIVFELQNQRFFVIESDDIDFVPIGLSLQPYYQWDDGFRLGVGFGPAMLMYGDRDHFQLPVSVTAGYTFMPDGPVSPYVRGGPSYHVASGDYVDGSNMGFLGGAGIEFLKSKRFSLALEATYDSAEVDIDNKRTGGTEGIRAAEFVVSLLFMFK